MDASVSLKLFFGMDYNSIWSTHGVKSSGIIMTSFETDSTECTSYRIMVRFGSFVKF